MNKTSVKGRRSLAQFFCLTPYSLWATLFIVVPLLFVAYYTP